MVSWTRMPILAFYSMVHLWFLDKSGIDDKLLRHPYSVWNSNVYNRIAILLRGLFYMVVYLIYSFSDFKQKHTHPPLSSNLSQRNTVIHLNSMVYIRFSDRMVVSGKLVRWLCCVWNSKMYVWLFGKIRAYFI